MTLKTRSFSPMGKGGRNTDNHSKTQHGPTEHRALQHIEENAARALALDGTGAKEKDGRGKGGG